MGQSPEELRYDIERTREGMDATLDRIEDRVSPSRIVERRRARARSAWGDVRERVMGTARDVRGEAQARSGEAGSRVDSARGELSDRADDWREEGMRQYHGNPLAAGLIAFGAGALLGSLLPETKPEQDAADSLQQRLEPVADELKEAGQELAEDLKDEGQQRLEEAKQTAAQAGQVVKEDARSSAESVRDESQDRAERLQDEARS